MVAFRTFIANHLPLIPKELIPAVSWGLVAIGLILIILFFSICVILINTKPKTITRKPQQQAAKPPVEQDVKYESLPLISGQLGEILALKGILSAGPITTTFLQIMNIIRHSTYDIRWRYKLPCIMMVGAPLSGKSTILNNLNFEHLTADGASIDSMWKLFKKGAIFEVPHSKSDDQKFWSFLGELFAFIRPRRPLDGIVITVSAEDLLHENANTIKQAQDMFEKIFNFQHFINFRLPIYILITKSDVIPGFEEFAHAFSCDARQQMIGWSSPYDLNTAFTPSWTDEIFATVEVGLRKAILFFARNKDLGEQLEKTVLFEAAFQEIKNNFSKYLYAMFHAHNPEDGLMLRGVYMVGKAKEAEAPSAAILQPSALSPKLYTNVEIGSYSNYNDYIYFIQDIFGEKIFKESNLAYPIKIDTLNLHQVNFRNKAILTISTAIFSMGWLWGNYHIKLKIDEYTSVMLKIKYTLSKIRRLETTLSSEKDQDVINRYITDLLKRMPIVKLSDVASFFVPQSWFSKLRTRINQTVELIFDSVVVRAMYVDLNLNTKHLLAHHESTNTNTKTDILSVQKFSSFLNLKTFVNRIVRLNKLSTEYNSMRSLESADSIIDLTDDLFDDKFAIVEEIKSHKPHPQLTPPKFDLQIFQDHIESKLDSLFSAFLKDVFDSTIEKVFDNVSHDIDRIKEAADLSSAQYTAQDLAKVYSKCELLHELVNNKNFAWVFAEHFSPHPDYTQMLTDIQTAGIVRPACMQTLLQKAEEEFHKFKTKLAENKTALTGSIMTANFSGLSSDFRDLQQDLKTILEQPFICAASGNLTTVIPDDKMLLWDQRQLKEIADLIDKYYEFMDKVPATIRPQFFDIYKGVVRKCIYNTLQAKLGNAQLFDDIPINNATSLAADSYKKQAENIKQVTLYLAKITKVLDEIQHTDNLPEHKLGKLLVAQYTNLLEKADVLLTNEKPYSADDSVFDNWDGTKPPRYLNMDHDSELKNYLASQFEQVKFFAKQLAAPAVELLKTPAIAAHVTNKDIVEKWSSLITNIDEYESKKPGNSIAALEDFLCKNLQNTSIQSIDTQGEVKSFANNGGDYFLDTRSAVAKSLLARAEIVKYDRAAEIYQQLSQFFETNLQGKFPFGPGQDEAALTDIRKLVELYESSIGSTIKTLEYYQNTKNVSDKALDFLKAIDKLIPFFKVWIQHSQSADESTALVSFQLQTRPDPKLESNTSSVLNRIFKINGITIHNNDKGIFFNDMSAELDFEWVEQTEEYPKTQKSAYLTADGTHALFSYEGRWALFRLIEEHKINRDIENPNGILLKFEVPIVNNNDKKSDMTKIVIRLSPLQKVGDKFVRLTWPVFPTQCPHLHENTTTQQNDDTKTSQATSSAHTPLDVDVSFDKDESSDANNKSTDIQASLVNTYHITPMINYLPSQYLDRMEQMLS